VYGGLCIDGIALIHAHLLLLSDRNYTGTPAEVKQDLLGMERRAIGAEGALKNELRRTLM
jgi:hypothetical protein